MAPEDAAPDPTVVRAGRSREEERAAFFKQCSAALRLIENAPFCEARDLAIQRLKELERHWATEPPGAGRRKTVGGRATPRPPDALPRVDSHNAPFEEYLRARPPRFEPLHPGSLVDPSKPLRPRSPARTSPARYRDVPSRLYEVRTPRKSDPVPRDPTPRRRALSASGFEPSVPRVAALADRAAEEGALRRRELEQRRLEQQVLTRPRARSTPRGRPNTYADVPSTLHRYISGKDPLPPPKDNPRARIEERREEERRLTTHPTRVAPPLGPLAPLGPAWPRGPSPTGSDRPVYSPPLRRSLGDPPSPYNPGPAAGTPSPFRASPLGVPHRGFGSPTSIGSPPANTRVSPMVSPLARLGSPSPKAGRQTGSVTLEYHLGRILRRRSPPRREDRTRRSLDEARSPPALTGEVVHQIFKAAAREEDLSVEQPDLPALDPAEFSALSQRRPATTEETRRGAGDRSPLPAPLPLDPSRRQREGSTPFPQRADPWVDSAFAEDFA